LGHLIHQYRINCHDIVFKNSPPFFGIPRQRRSTHDPAEVAISFPYEQQMCRTN